MKYKDSRGNVKLGDPRFSFYTIIYLLTECDECGETKEYGYDPDGFNPFIQKRKKNVGEEETK